MQRLDKTELARFKSCPVRCPRLNLRIRSLSDYFAVISSAIKTADPFWFRGHAKFTWSLTASALRFPTRRERERALELLTEFKRVAEIKLERPPHPDDQLMWVQLARHYGLPTRLLDWTESATIALFFACPHPEVDGLVFLLNPVDLNRLSYPKTPRILDGQSDRKIINKYLRLKGGITTRGSCPIAINPVWNSERLMLQRGVFTIEGSGGGLDQRAVPSLVGIPILRESKPRLLDELQRIGVDEMTIFPELEHACRHLVRKAGLGQGE